MRHLISLIVLTLYLNTSFGQNFNGYKYVAVNVLTYQNGGTDNFGLSSTLIKNFDRKGFNVLPNDKTNWPLDAKSNPCLVIFCYPFHSGASTVGFTIKNCKNEIIFEEKSTSANWVNDYQDNFNRALSNCWNRFNQYSYHFEPSKTPEIELPEVEKTTETEESMRTYLSANKLDPLEGIYKSYQSDNLSYYKFGIIKRGETFKAIIIESDYKQWKQGEVKAIFEQSSMKGLYSVKWNMGNKTPFETFGLLENEGILSIEFKNPTNGEKRQDKFIKMFPIVSNDITVKKDNSKASGSGFFLTTNGVIATNAHVVEGASNIEVTISNEVGMFTYKAKVLLSDNKNDVAILQIADDDFKGLSTIPYGVTENSDVGSRVFTIGYPLNDVMGSNYKVTDGIISAISGINDDMRYYQISVPLQPGNSGGPLFNKEGNIIGITSAKLNEKAVGTQIENVNYAIKSSYLLNLYNMLPNSTKLPTTSNVASKELQDQVKILKNYVCLIKIF